MSYKQDIEAELGGMLIVVAGLLIGVAGFIWGIVFLISWLVLP